MGKNGQAKILSDSELSKIRKNLKSARHKLLFDLLRYTGERIGAVCELRVADCYDFQGRPLDEITFRAVTRKASPEGKRQTRQCPTHPALYESLSSYKQPAGGYLFPARLNESDHLSKRGAAFILGEAIARSKLQGRGISSHSFRRTAITRMSEAGMDARTIQTAIGHSSIATTQRYIEQNPERVKRAINVL